MKNLELLKNIREKQYSKSKINIRISGVKINTEQSIKEMNKFYKEFADQIALVNFSPWQSSYENDINNIKEVCSELYRRIFIWWDGKVNPCDYDYKSVLSSLSGLTVHQESIKNIWNSDFYNNLRLFHHSDRRKDIEPCKRCITI